MAARGAPVDERGTTTMRSVGQIADALTGLLPHLGGVDNIVEEAVRMRQFPSYQLVEHVEDYARVVNEAAIDLAAHPGYEGIAKSLSGDALGIARKAGVMHGMNEHHNWFTSGWYNAFDPHVGNVTRAVQQLT
jgi:hypothetical protein